MHVQDLDVFAESQTKRPEDARVVKKRWEEARRRQEEEEGVYLEPLSDGRLDFIYI